MKKTRRKNTLCIVCAMLFVSLFSLQSLQADEKEGVVNTYIDAIALDIGQSKGNINIYRLGLRKNFDTRWWSERQNLLGYYELSLNYWDSNSVHHHNNTGVAFSPVLRYTFDFENWHPYIEGGIGVSLFNHTKIGQRDLSTHFLFEDRIGIGIVMGDLDFGIRYMHYSNADIKKPNEGIDIVIGSLVYRF